VCAFNCNVCCYLYTIFYGMGSHRQSTYSVGTDKDEEKDQGEDEDQDEEKDEETIRVIVIDLTY
jgi:hypothetical protein